MSPIANPQPEPAADELVAYLDGELPPDDCRRVEERLAADAAYRRQLHDLDQAWVALDALPSPKAHDDFARTTMELVTVAARDDVSSVTASAAAVQRRRTLWLAVSGIAGILLGFAAAWALMPQPNQALLGDLPVIRQADVLRHVPDIAFLRRLADEAPLDEIGLDEAAIQRELVQLAGAGDDSLEARRRWIEGLASEEKADLSAHAKRFERQSEAEKQRLRDLQQDIRGADDGPHLQRTLVAYGQWLARLTAGEKEQLRQDLHDLAAEEQVDRVQRFMRQEREQASRRLSAEESDALRAEVLAIAAERQSQIMSELRGRGDAERARRLEGPRGAVIILSRELQNSDSDAARRLIGKLSAEARSHLERLGGWRRRLQLWQWVVDSLQPKIGPGELETFFAEKLDNDQRELLLNMPPNEMQAQLERLYFSAELGYGDAGAWWNEFRESGGGPRTAPRQGRPGLRPDGPPHERGRHDPNGPQAPDRDRWERGGPPRPPRDDRPPGRRTPNRPLPPEDRPAESI